MSAIEFTAPPSMTFTVQLYDSVSNTAVGSPVAATEASPGRYRATVTPASGIVYVVATGTNYSIIGYANLDYPGNNGYSEVLDNYEDAALAGTIQPVPPAEDIQPGDVREGVTYLDSLGNPQTGTLRIPSEADVRLDVAFGAGGTEFFGELVVAVGGFDAGQNPNVLDNGQIRSPLWIGTAYLLQYGNGFTWRVAAPANVLPADVTVHFRGRKQCDESSSYAWDAEDVNIAVVVVDGITYWDISFELTKLQTSLIEEGTYRWWLVAETAADDIVLQQYSVYNPLRWSRA